MELYEEIQLITTDVMSRAVELHNDPELGPTLAFAAKAHQGQWRKYQEWLPYITHPMRVSRIVRAANGSIAMQQAALLHDTVEDTDVTLETIYSTFGDVVGAMVDGLTDISKPGDGNRAVRKALDRKHSAKQSPETQTVKYADLIDNTINILQYDPNFAKVYLEEKTLLLEVMNKGDARLYEIAWYLVREGKKQLEQLAA